MGPMRRYVFERVRLRAVKAVACAGCGKAVRRTRTFERTINPFNVNTQGEPKTYFEVQADNRAEAEHWRAQPEKCRTCLRAAMRPASDDLFEGAS